MESEAGGGVRFLFENPGRGVFQEERVGGQGGCQRGIWEGGLNLFWGPKP